jgi:hypothetical protein
LGTVFLQAQELHQQNIFLVMSTYIQVFKNKSKHSKIFLLLCLGFIMTGITGLIITFLFKKPFIPFLNESGYFILIFNGIISFLIVLDSIRKAKYFVSWNDNELSYLLPKSEKTELIRFESIRSFTRNRSGIIIELDNGETKHFNLNYFFYPERMAIINFFGEIKKN